MKQNIKLIGITGLALVLGACREETVVPEPVVPVVETIEIGEAELGGLRKLPATIEASERADLSFRVSGQLSQLLVSEGEDVEKGQVLAVLEQQDFQTRLSQAEAAFNRAEADFGRARALIDDGVISRKDYDQIESRYKRTKASLGKAEADLAYTELRAPFTGLLAQRHVENFEEVQQGQSIFSLRSVDQVDVKLDVPESLVILVTEDVANPVDDPVEATVSFQANPDQQYPLTFKEVATRADELSKTFELTYLMKAPDDFNVLPGMTADVTVNMPSLRGNVYNVPTRAVFGDIHMEPRIWLLDRSSMTVSLKPVRIGRLTGASVEVLEGLSPGDEVVISPTNFLLEGQEVQMVDDSLDAIEAATGT